MRFSRYTFIINVLSKMCKASDVIIDRTSDILYQKMSADLWDVIHLVLTTASSGQCLLVSSKTDIWVKTMDRTLRACRALRATTASIIHFLVLIYLCSPSCVKLNSILTLSGIGFFQFMRYLRLKILQNMFPLH